MAFYRQQPWRRYLWRQVAKKGDDELPLTYDLPESKGGILRFYDALSDDFLGEIRAEDRNFLYAKFKVTVNGCDEGEVGLISLPPYIRSGVRCDIYRDSTRCWYSGRVSDIVVPAREGDIVLTLTGVAEDLGLKIVNQVYGSRAAIDTAVSNGDITSTQAALITVVTDISDIVKDIVSGIESRSAILYDISKIETTEYTPGIVDFDHITLDSALEKLADLAGTFDYGVGADRYFFFRERSGGDILNLWEGVSCDSVSVEEDGTDIWNKIWVKAGKVDNDKSSYLSDPIEDTESQGKYGIRETVVSASNLDSTDAGKYGQWYLKEHKDPVISATINLVPLDQWEDAPTCGGYVRVTLGSKRDTLVDQDGDDDVDLYPEYTLTLEDIEITLSPGGSFACIEAGKKQQEIIDVLKGIIRKQEDGDSITDSRFKDL